MQTNIHQPHDFDYIFYARRIAKIVLRLYDLTILELRKQYCIKCT